MSSRRVLGAVRVSEWVSENGRNNNKANYQYLKKIAVGVSESFVKLLLFHLRAVQVLGGKPLFDNQNYNIIIDYRLLMDDVIYTLKWVLQISPKMESVPNAEEPTSWDELYNINLMPSELFFKFRKELQGIRVGLNMEVLFCLPYRYSFFPYPNSFIALFLSFNIFFICFM